MSGEERTIQLIALVIAEMFVGFTWILFATIVIVFVNRHVSRLAPGGKMETWGWAMGVASFCFWPAAIVLGIVFLRDPKQVRIGRACVIGGLLNVTMAVVISCVITAVLYLKFPEYIPR